MPFECDSPASEELAYVQKHFLIKQRAIERAANRGELVWSPGTDAVRVTELQASYRQAVAARYERMFGQQLDMSRLNADHPVDLIVGGSATQRLKMLDESVNKSVGASLFQAGRKAGLKPGDQIGEFLGFQGNSDDRTENNAVCY